MSNLRPSPAWALLLGLFVTQTLPATDASPPAITNINGSGTTRNIRFVPFPGAQSYTFYSAPDPGGPFTVNTNFQMAPYIKGYTTIIITNTPLLVTNLAYEWRLTNVTAPSEFYTMSTTPMSSNALIAGHVLNRLAYGPTPDELERVAAIGPQNYINEQLNIEGIPEPPPPNYTSETTNSIPADPTTIWNFISVTGTLAGATASGTFYMFTTAPGEIFIDDLELRPFRYMQRITTNVVNNTNVYTTNKVFSHIGPNLLKNGDLESGYSFWTNAGGASASANDNTRSHSGSSCLHVVSTTGASSTGTSYVRQGFTNASYLTTNTWGNTVTLATASADEVVLNYWYLPGPTSSKLRLQLGSGINTTPGGIPPTPTWIRATATGQATANSSIYVYLSSAGTCYVDDIKLVAGTTPDVGANLVVNGGFESALPGSWTNTANFAGSKISTTTAHSGNGSLQVIATDGGSGGGNAVYQIVAPALVDGATYSVSYWYSPVTPGANLTVRLSGSLLVSAPDTGLAGAVRRLNAGAADLPELRAWFCLNAVHSPRQLFEVLSQFWENHFVTQQSKGEEYLLNLGFDGTAASVLSTDWEFREMTKWRNAMLNPNCTFYDLLRISAESPAMIAYLDTVNSKGNDNNIANENYARELLELFTFGVDNGYDQNDIILLSRAWTGWSISLVDTVNADNVFAPSSQTYYPGVNGTATADKVGVLAFNYKSVNHGTNRGPLFAGKTVPARFGPPWTTKTYSANVPLPGRYDLVIPPRATGTTNSIQDGYDVIAHLANLPFTQEYLSVKLCRLFVHDDFPNPNATVGLPEYDFYDYTNPDRSAEAELIHQCMLAWENSTPKGNIRAVLSVIFNSDLFRSHTAVAQKVKTPFEFVASSLRALRTTNANGTLTSTTDGFSFSTPLNSMGGMLLFNRAAPDGYPENGPSWINAGTLVERIRFVQALCMTNGASGRGDAGNNLVDPVALLKRKASSGNWNNAGVVADYFLGIIYPGEGAANLALYRNAAINFLNTADNGTTPYAFSSLGNTSGIYENRVRGMVAMLMTFQRFQEQ